MKIHKLKDFTRGWIVGDFEPNIIKTKDFEFMVRHYSKGEKESAHVHILADEVTVIISGTFKMNNKTLDKGDIVHLLPNDAADFECLEDGTTAVIKTPSARGDKYLI